MKRPLSRCSLGRTFSFLLSGLLVVVLGFPSSLYAAISPDGSSGTAEEIRFSVAELSPAFVGDSDAVVRLDHRVLEIKDRSEAVYRVHRAVTVFGPEGREHGRLVEFYDEFREIDDFDGYIRDARGQVLRDLDDGDVEDVSLSGGTSLQVDTRTRLVHMTHSQYPYTVEYEYEIEYDGYFSLPRWRPQASGEVPVEQAYLVVRSPIDGDIRHHVENGPLEFEKHKTGDHIERTWSVKLKPSEERPPHAPPWSHVAPTVHLAPSTFEMSDYPGTISSWEDFGSWFYQLYEDQQTLPSALKREVDAIVQQTDSEKATVAALYRFMQDRTRYISIQLGIGGWRPFSAEYVHERGYGDCKALTNYLWAMLRYAGIDAVPAAIYRSRSHEPFLTDFPSNQFNHVVLAVPSERDTLWVEATSQWMPLGHLHGGIADRPALLITPDGGRLVRTPPSTAAQNERSRRVDIALTLEGDAQALMTTVRTGALTDIPRRRLANASPDDAQAWMRNQFDVPNVSLRSIDVGHATERDLHLRTFVDAILPRLATVAGSRLFVPLTITGKTGYVPRPDDAQTRTVPVVVSRYPLSVVDSTTFEIPNGYAIEALPDSAGITNRAGSFRAHAVEHGDQSVTYVRRLSFPDAELPPDAYEEYRSLRRAMARSSRQQMVLVED